MRRHLPLLAAILALTACTAEDATTSFTNAPRSPRAGFIDPLPQGVVPSPAREVEPVAASASGPPVAGCDRGWVTPPPDSADRDVPLRLIRRRLGVPGEPVVVEMRLFVGPESPPSEKGYIQSIRRWYVKLAYPGEPGAEGRFLVEERGFGTGLVAVAPMRSRGFSSPDWVGFQYDIASPPLRYPGLPGTWRGVPYDFVAGGGGLTIPGLPASVAGCLDGT